jgi:hypothetical protein
MNLLKYPEVYASRSLWSPRPGDGCVLWLPGQDDPQSATIRDRSGYNNHGTLTGATWARLPTGLWVLSFDGVDDIVTVNSSTSINGVTAFTIMTWIRFTSVGGTQMIMEQGTPSNGIAWQILLSTILVSGVFGGVSVTIVTPVINTWYHATFTFVKNGANTTVVGYLNGASVGTVTSTELTTVAGDNLYFGARGGLSLEFSGNLGLIKKFNIVLPAAQISKIYQSERYL